MCDARAVYEKLREYENKEEDGLMVVLPTKYMYQLVWEAPPGCKKSECNNIFDDVTQCALCELSMRVVRKVPSSPFLLRRVGLDVFLTEEEAETALKG